jgi:hypothetical protein
MSDSWAGIQYKGTDICMDLNCKCGVNSHYDGFGAYYIKCPGCGQVFQMETTIKEVAEAPVGCPAVLMEDED